MKRLEQSGDLAARAEELGRDPRLREALASLVRDPRGARVALTAPREFLVESGVEVPEDLEVSFVRAEPGLPRAPLGGRFVPDFEFFVFRLFDCHTYWLPKKDDDGKFIGYEEVQVCFGFEITPKFLSRGPWS